MAGGGQAATWGKSSMTTTGGDKLMASLRAAMAIPKEIEGTVGFHDRRIASLAASHEFGERDRDGGVTLPERPAFRQGVRRGEDMLREATAKVSAHQLNRAKVGELMGLMRDEVKASYRSFRGEPLSERQEARKKGTAGAGKQLVGHEGERLINRIEARVDGDEVG